jgi:c-di-AMP phosphodiesterase-like protein
MKASVVLTLYNGTIYLSARSIDEVNVQVMMEKLGGGGHRTIAGAQLKDTTIEEAIQQVKDVIKDMLEKGDIL